MAEYPLRYSPQALKYLSDHANEINFVALHVFASGMLIPVPNEIQIFNINCDYYLKQRSIKLCACLISRNKHLEGIRHHAAKALPLWGGNRTVCRYCSYLRRGIRSQF